MRPRVATTVIVGLFIAAACTSAATHVPATSTPTSPAASQPASSASTALTTPQPGTPGSGVQGAWTATGNMVTPHAFHAATRLRDGKVLVTGGLVNDRLDGKVLTASELYEPGSGTWTAAKGMIEARWGHTATLLLDGRVLVAGSYRNSSDPLASAELYDPSSGRWTATGTMTRGRGGHTATLLPDGRVLVVGGGAEDNSLEGGPRSASAELYDPGSGRWTATGSMIEARQGFTATLLPDGTVLVAGGDGGFTAAELYDPRRGTWTVTGSMADGRFGHTATLLPDGSVLVAGGCACSEPGAWASAELYDASSGTWTGTGSMGTARIFHTATMLAGGSVLVVNDGLTDDRPPSAELYDPRAGTWAATANPAEAHGGRTATLLLDGQVLVAGDYDYPSQASAELYDPELRLIDLVAVIGVAEADRFETFGDKSILLEHVWSPKDVGLGGACGPANVPWLECLNVPNWMIQPVGDDAGCPATGSCYDGARLGILYEPSLAERLGPGDGPVDVIGHFGDPASQGCRPENRAACQDRFVVTAIEKSGR